MKMSRKVFVFATLAMLVFSLIAVSAKPGKATIHVQTYGYEGRDLLKLKVEIAGEDSDSFYSCYLLYRLVTLLSKYPKPT
ncbi:MAG: hypothetical protein AYK19_14825 [Theionarchaea archaeon DG-70-1]|nr:MAG: hypothetical protein AYK19_14825 [Theionarchaea archaeon DG-70-1]